MTLRKEINKKECLCAAYDESECGCGNFPSRFNLGYNQACDDIKERLEKMPRTCRNGHYMVLAPIIDKLITELSDGDKMEPTEGEE